MIQAMGAGSGQEREADEQVNYVVNGSNTEYAQKLVRLLVDRASEELYEAEDAYQYVIPPKPVANF